MSIGPSASCVRATSSVRAPCGSERSAGKAMQVPPIASMRRRVSSRPSTLRAVIATFAPSAAKRNAIAVPVPPWLAPVTNATLPAHDCSDMSETPCAMPVLHTGEPGS
jgi:hypothetical protein